MAIDGKKLRDRGFQLARHPRTRKLALWFFSVLVAVGLLALAAPPLLRGKLASELSKALHRDVSIQQIRVNPYAMSTTIRGFLMKERQDSATAVSFDELYVNLELQSLFRWGPVLKKIRLVKPYINLVRNDDYTYNFTDLIDEFTKGPPGPTPRFSLNNIEIVDGRIDFDDRPEGVKHAVTSIRLGVPFVSSIPAHVDITVQPVFSATVNGAPLDIGGDTKPFKDSRDSTVHLDIDKLQIPKYLEYSPVELNFKVPSGQMDAKIRASFKTSKDNLPILAISGNVEIKDLVVQGKDGAPLLGLPSFEVLVDSLEVFANKASLKSIKAQAPELHVTRNREGTLNLASLVTAGKAEAPPEQKKNGTPFAYRVDEIALENGKLHFTDRVPQRLLQTRLDDVHLGVKGLSNEPDKKADVEISFQTDAKERFSQSGTLQLTPFAAEGKFAVEKLQLRGFRPYYESVVGVEIREGLMDLTANFSFARKEETVDAKLSELNVVLRSLRLDVPGESDPLWRISLLALKDTTVDIGKKTVLIGALEGRDGNGFIHREADGTLSYARLVKAQASGSPAKEPVKDEGWRVDSKRVVLDRFRIVFEDRSLKTPSRVVVSELSGRGENFSNAKNSRGKATVRAKINNKGTLGLLGTASTNPPAAQFDVEAREIEILPFQPYIADQVNFLLTGGALGTKGKLVFETGADGPAKLGYEGSVQVTDFATVEKDGSQDLLKWKSLGLDGLKFALNPTQVRINEVNLAEFYARLILGADGKINLQKLTAHKNNQDVAVETQPAKPPEPAASAPPREQQITIGKINLQNGNVLFSDFFVKPNYSANLTGVQGSISELKPETPGDLAIQAKLDNAAPVDIQGKINPLSKDLYMDIVAEARDIELNTMSPYSVKYVGYGIEKGKLSFNVKYKVENRKLEAQNQIILNQLTFGERVESPTATKLPVLLAVALLKDRNGVIDVNLPISGSLDSPEFSVGGIILRIIINIITRAVTAPFALLGAAFGGGGGEELSYIEFDYGRANLPQAAEAKIKTLATAMNNRPALKVEISGRVDPTNDLEGIKRAGIERKVKAQKMRELGRQGVAPKSVDDVQVDKAEYERFLKAAYGAESFPKPRNIVGLAKDIPVPEMEALMLKHTQVSEDDLRELGNRRAQAVRDRLLASGQVGADRLFIVGAKSLTADDKEKPKSKASRVEFSLR
jgi:uncharacterized protein involved in outer membrane biogenesis